MQDVLASLLTKRGLKSAARPTSDSESKVAPMAKEVALASGWYNYVLTANVDVARPGIMNGASNRGRLRFQAWSGLLRRRYAENTESKTNW